MAVCHASSIQINIREWTTMTTLEELMKRQRDMNAVLLVMDIKL